MGEKSTGTLYIGAVGGGEMAPLGEVIDTAMYEPEFNDDTPVIGISAFKEPMTFECKLDYNYDVSDNIIAHIDVSSDIKRYVDQKFKVAWRAIQKHKWTKGFNTRRHSRTFGSWNK